MEKVVEMSDEFVPLAVMYETDVAEAIRFKFLAQQAKTDAQNSEVLRYAADLFFEAEESEKHAQEYEFDQHWGVVAEFYEEAMTRFQRAIEKTRKKKLKHLQKLTNAIGMEFVLLVPGEFLMGSPEGKGDAEEHPLHKVYITKPFYLQITPVTQVQWMAVMDNNPSSFRGDDLPVNKISWQRAQDFLRRLNKSQKGSYRLPTEAEWEYACRAGSQTKYCFGDDRSRLGEYAWYAENSGDQTHPVAKKKANAWGLFDMHGNVNEWVQDRYDEEYYHSSPAQDPRGPSEGDIRVIRGGCYGDIPYCNRSACRLRIPSRFYSSSMGLRIVREVG